MNKFEDELKANNIGMQVVSDKDSLTKSKKKKYDTKLQSKYKDQKKNEKVLNSALDKEKANFKDYVPDPAEPKYCYCNHYSHGEM